MKEIHLIVNIVACSKKPTNDLQGPLKLIGEKEMDCTTPKLAAENYHIL